MSKIFLVTCGILLVGLVSLIVISQINKSNEIILGTKYESQGKNHIQINEKHPPYSSDLPSSGPHYADSESPAQWGIYTSEIAPEVYLHNLEHGGVVIAYNPETLPSADLKGIRALFSSPYSNNDFMPKKFLLFPRETNTSVIQMASWTYTLNLDTYSEETIIKFFKQHAGNAPEGNAGPTNQPINQAS